MYVFEIAQKDASTEYELLWLLLIIQGGLHQHAKLSDLLPRIRQQGFIILYWPLVQILYAVQDIRAEVLCIKDASLIKYLAHVLYSFILMLNMQYQYSKWLSYPGFTGFLMWSWSLLVPTGRSSFNFCDLIEAQCIYFQLSLSNPSYPSRQYP